MRYTIPISLVAITLAISVTVILNYPSNSPPPPPSPPAINTSISTGIGINDISSLFTTNFETDITWQSATIEGIGVAHIVDFPSGFSMVAIGPPSHIETLCLASDISESDLANPEINKDEISQAFAHLTVSSFEPFSVFTREEFYDFIRKSTMPALNTNDFVTFTKNSESMWIRINFNSGTLTTITGIGPPISEETITAFQTAYAPSAPFIYHQNIEKRVIE